MESSTTTTTSSIPASNPTATALQARLSSQTRTLIQRLENILATLLPQQQTFDPSSPSPITSASMSHTQTATESLQISVETSALIRACEELMALTRGMKEIWLVGGLDTLDSSAPAPEKNGGDDGKINDGESNGEKVARNDDMEVTIRALLQGLTGKAADR